MALARASIRDKLNLLLLVPLLATVLLAVPFVASRVDDARAASATAAAATNARRISDLLYALQNERLAAIDHIAAPGDHQHSLMLRQQAVVDDAVADLRTGFDLEALRRVRVLVASGYARADQAYRGYGKVIDGLLDGLGLHAGIEGSTVAHRQLETLDALLYMNEQSSRASAALLVAGVDARAGQDLLAEATALQAWHTDRFLGAVGRRHAELMRVVEQGRSSLLLRRLAERVRLAEGTLDRGFVTEARQAAESVAVIRQLLLVRTLGDVEAAASSAADRSVAAAWTVGLGTGFMFALVVALGIAVSRSIAGPVRQLTRAASAVAEAASAELARVSDSEHVDDRPPRLAAIPVRSGDEVGDLAAAFNRVQATAALLLERQVQSRRNVGLMFASVARRTQNLVGGQLALIDQLERDEQDPRLLAELYRLDHLSMRLRRTAESLLVVSGVRDEARLAVPAQLATVLRSALAEIEDFRRVRLVSVCEVTVAPGAVGDLTLLLAELLENATSYSPPTMVVDVSADLTPAGCRIVIVDHGIGMTPEQLAAENDRFVRRERLDIAPTTVLGLFVVGRLARRHGLAVMLLPTPGGGVTAVVDVPARLLASELPGGPPVTTTAVRGRPAGIPPAIVAASPGSEPFAWFSHTPSGDGEPPAPAPAPAPVEAPVEPPVEPPAQVPVTRGGLTRRVPGASLPNGTRPPAAPGVRPAARDPERERAELDAFAAAVARAAAETQSGVTEEGHRG